MRDSRSQENQNDASIQCRGYIPSLDGLRGVAIILVLCRHITVIEPSDGLQSLVINLLDLGWVGVDLFFVLSGFLITGILLDTKGERRSYLNFYGRRFLRIFPLYYAYLVLVLLLIPLALRFFRVEWPTGINEDGWWFWVYLSNVYYSLGGMAHMGSLMVTWSLAVEEQFYLIWPAVVFLCSPRVLLRVCLSVILGALLVRMSLIYADASGFAVYSLLPCRIDTLATGALMAVLARSQVSVSRSVRIAKVALLVGILVVGSISLIHGPHWGNPWNLTVGLSAVSILFGGLVWLVVTMGPGRGINRILETRPMLFIGKISYCIYIIHTLTIIFVQRVLFDPAKSSVVFGSQFATQALFFVPCLALIIFFASLSWRVYERPILRLKRFFEYEHLTPSRERAPEEGIQTS